MTGSKQGHKRFTISRKLKELVGRDILLVSGKSNIFKIESGELKFQTQKNSDKMGFYFNQKQVPVRSIKKINYYYSPPEVIVDIDYLKTYKETLA